jgi:5'-nucleotidase
MEAVISGIPAIAVSLGAYENWDFRYAADFAAQLAQGIAANGLSHEVLLNVNVPNLPREQIAGVEITRLGKLVYRDVLIKRKDPTGKIYYWIAGEVPSGLPGDGTDIKAISENKISITPIHLDLTNHNLIEHLQTWKFVI